MHAHAVGNFFADLAGFAPACHCHFNPVYTTSRPFRSFLADGSQIVRFSVYVLGVLFSHSAGACASKTRIPCKGLQPGETLKLKTEDLPAKNAQTVAWSTKDSFSGDFGLF